MLLKVLTAIKEAQAELAYEALAKPKERDAFEYGRVSGMHAGLEQALRVVEDLLRDEDDRD